jgi:hypothetical protein
VRSALAPGELLARIDAELAGPRKWTRQPAPPGAHPAASVWTFRGASGEPWNGTATVEAPPGQPGTLKLTMAVSRADR